MEIPRCNSCGVGLIGVGNIKFMCPKCGKEIIYRCSKCRANGVEYICKNCEFIGP